MAPLYKVGVSEDRNKKCRRTMEDSHAFIYDFGGVKVRSAMGCLWMVRDMGWC
jgi:hypothetical protein